MVGSVRYMYVCIYSVNSDDSSPKLTSPLSLLRPFTGVNFAMGTLIGSTVGYGVAKNPSTYFDFGVLS